MILQRVYDIINICLKLGYYGEVIIRIENGIIVKCSATQDYIK
jgi:hypothetical protein